MSVLATKLFWADAIERAVKTVAQTLVSLWLIADAIFNILTVDWKQAFGVATGAGVLSLLMSISSAGTGNSASLVVDSKVKK